MDNQMIDLSTVIGVYGLCNTVAILVHAVDHNEEKVLISLNGSDPEWVDIKEEYVETSEELELGFSWGKLFIPFIEVMRINGGSE